MTKTFIREEKVLNFFYFKGKVIIFMWKKKRNDKYKQSCQQSRVQWVFFFKEKFIMILL
jgi:hypothetical protein